MPARRLRRRAPKVLAAAATAAVVAPLLVAAGTSGGDRAPTAGAGGTISLVAYSTPEPAFGALISAFQATSIGMGSTGSESYGPSGGQVSAVMSGLPADVVNFSIEPDMENLVQAGMVATNWDAGPTHGFVSNSIVSFIVRKGNPQHIENWSDLVRHGVGVITPNPFSSGSAKWNVLAAYGAEIAQGKEAAGADAYLAQLLEHTVDQPSSAGNALQVFLSGQGDVLLDYEDDALYAQRKGEPITVVTPPRTILIQTPIAVTKHAANPTEARAFESFLLSPAGQRIWGEQGYRPVLPEVAAQFHFPKPQDLFTVGSLGGWTKVDAALFDPQRGSIAKIEQGLGVSTSSG